jgi:protein TonB
MNLTSSRYPILIALIISLLIHGASLTLRTQIPANAPQIQPPLYVEVLPAQKQRETALPQQPQKPPEKARREGAIDQTTPKEIAPRGLAAEDSSRVVAQPKPIIQQPEKQPKPVEPPLPKTQLPPDPSPDAISLSVPKPQIPLPSLEQLLQSSNTAAADIARSSQTKQRPDVESGDTLILNMNKDKLFSFFSRFKKGIYNVWNYPQESIKKRQQGRTLLTIIINRDGSIDGVELIQGSGFERLDREAIAAIFKGQPYGALPQDYREDKLTINAYFEYIMGQSKPNIYRQ